MSPHHSFFIVCICGYFVDSVNISLKDFLCCKFSEKATSEKNTTEQWDVIMNICDNIGNSGKNAKDCIRSIMKRLNNPDPHVVIQAITVSFVYARMMRNFQRPFYISVT